MMSLFLVILGGQCLVALLPLSCPRQGKRKRPAFVVPAHNEATEIESTLRNIRSQLLAHDRLIVVADNCDDDTAQLARITGAEVVERQDGVKRGKGYAMDAGVRYLEPDPPEVVLILDADCRIEPELIENLAETVDGMGRPVQALYLMRTASQANSGTVISSFAFLVKDWIRPRALRRVSLPVLLTGTGMAFPWEIIRDALLAFGEIVEDLALGLEQTKQNLGPIFLTKPRSGACCLKARKQPQVNELAGSMVI